MSVADQELVGDGRKCGWPVVPPREQGRRTRVSPIAVTCVPNRGQAPVERRLQPDLIAPLWPRTDCFGRGTQCSESCVAHLRLATLYTPASDPVFRRGRAEVNFGCQKKAETTAAPYSAPNHAPIVEQKMIQASPRRDKGFFSGQLIFINPRKPLRPRNRRCYR